ncbi:sphinganine kinase lcb4 [Marasmius crinis-equi]|uniref:Sphinganine kinase lcb4 n=1 Tax=Marasmius crinis-equi TaxID=585013 RepID=A0ABR3F4T5_9AGAR
MSKQVQKIDILIPVKNITRTCSLEDSQLSISDSKETVEIPFRHVVSSSFECDTKTLEVAYVWRKKPKGPLHFAKVTGIVKEPCVESAKEWCEGLTEKAYPGVKRNRRLKVLVNPHGGPGKAVSIFKKTVEPILRAAGCSLDIIHTTHSGHGFEIASKLDIQSFDALLTVSGDGLVHEVLNGFAKHAEPGRALQMPIAPVPTGSGNALSINVLGIKDGFDVVAAAINAIKGSPMTVDLLLVTQNGKSSISFMSQTVGLMADLDLGTEHLRWMGDTRFFVGLLQGLIKFKTCDIELSYKAVEVNKSRMADTLRGKRKLLQEQSSSSPPSSELPTGEPFRPRYSTTETEGWTTFDKSVLYVYAGKGPYVGRDYMVFPVSLPDDGLIDICARCKTSRGELLSTLDDGPKGTTFWNENVHYIKAHAYRIKPLSKNGRLSIDGEAFPFEEFQVEVLPKQASLLSLYNSYALDPDFTL